MGDLHVTGPQAVRLPAGLFDMRAEEVCSPLPVKYDFTMMVRCTAPVYRRENTHDFVPQVDGSNLKGASLLLRRRRVLA